MLVPHVTQLVTCRDNSIAATFGDGCQCSVTIKHCNYSILKSPEFSPGGDAENIQSIKVLSFGNEFREVMAVRVNQEKFRKGIA